MDKKRINENRAPITQTTLDMIEAKKVMYQLFGPYADVLYSPLPQVPRHPLKTPSWKEIYRPAWHRTYNLEAEYAAHCREKRARRKALFCLALLILLILSVIVVLIFVYIPFNPKTENTP